MLTAVPPINVVVFELSLTEVRKDQEEWSQEFHNRLFNRRITSFVGGVELIQKNMDSEARDIFRLGTSHRHMLHNSHLICSSEVCITARSAAHALGREVKRDGREEASDSWSWAKQKHFLQGIRFIEVMVDQGSNPKWNMVSLIISLCFFEPA